MSRLRESIRQVRDGEKELTEHEIENKQGGCREMAAIKKGRVTQNESLLPKFLHKKRWLTITIFLRYML